MASRRFKARVVQDDKTTGCGIELPFNPKDVLGKVRAPVVATIRKHTFRTTTCAMDGAYWIPLNKANRDAAGVAAGDAVTVTLTLDEAPRVVTPPDDFAAAIKKSRAASAAWAKLSFSHQREHVEAIEGARKPETRARRIEKAIDMLTTPAAGSKPKSAAQSKPTSPQDRTSGAKLAAAGKASVAKRSSRGVASGGGQGQFAGVGSDAVMRATGKDWEQWFNALDEAGARALPHKDIAALLSSEFRVPDWWSQMVTVGYEQARLGRKKHEKPGGFEVGVSRTIQAPMSALYAAWSDARQRLKWLKPSESKFEIRTATPNKSMRITWIDGCTHVDAYFNAKTGGKNQIAVQHKKLPTAEEGERMKALWADRLDALKALLEG